jgi:hypothetical protein
MIDPKTRRLVRELMRALQTALPAVREADRAYRALIEAAEKPARPSRREVPRAR